MLIAAGILFVLALLFYFIDRWFEHAGMNLMWVVRLLLFVAVILIGLNFYVKRQSGLKQIDEPNKVRSASAVNSPEPSVVPR